MTYIHYGDTKFDYDLFDRIRNRNESCGVLGIKPLGGLWATPKEASYIDWKKWCLSNEFNCDRLAYYFEFNLTQNAKIFHIANADDVYELVSLGCCDLQPASYRYLNPTSEIPPVEKIDFEMLVKLGYDGFELHMNQNLYWAMYGWDCDTLLIFNPDVIIEC